MKTLEQLLTYPGGENCNLIDGRDISRLIEFIPAQYLEKFGYSLIKEGQTWEPLEYNRENVLKKLEKDLAFAFEKALNKRGISAGLMYDVIKMWMWVLDDELYEFSKYAQYGLPLFKAVAIKYGFPNRIGEDNGDEYGYSSEGDY